MNMFFIFYRKKCIVTKKIVLKIFLLHSTITLVCLKASYCVWFYRLSKENAEKLVSQLWNLNSTDKKLWYIIEFYKLN